ncbi:MAG TPA: pyrroline-5-carboxylate reductase [Verrucomicrobiae bacterium]|nr:pyrroline-5-carboxylate reductase [Verrucomicrobiae bacterium]
MLQGKTVGFVGAGSMTEALLKGIVNSGTVAAKNILVTNKENTDRLARLVQTWQVAKCSKEELVRSADVVILAVKPKDIAEVLKQIGGSLRQGQLVISVAAGIPTAFIEDFCPVGVQVIRAMPNTSCTVLASATAIATGKYADAEAASIAIKLFSSVGKVEQVAEEQLDVITGLSGSGPAYVYYMVEALEQAGEQLGLPKEMALKLATQTVFGAAKMLLETGEQPTHLRTKVSSPGGTTLAGLQALRTHGFHEALCEAVKAASARSKEMGLEFTSLSGGGIHG